jgi:hypothetical protein
MVTTLERRCTRIAAALATLAREESAAVRSGDFDRVTEIQDRAAPLIEFLLLQRDIAFGVRELLERCQAQREETSRWLDGEMARMRNQRNEWVSHQRRLARVGPAYSAGGTLSSRFSLAG